MQIKRKNILIILSILFFLFVLIFIACNNSGNVSPNASPKELETNTPSTINTTTYTATITMTPTITSTPICTIVFGYEANDDNDLLPGHFLLCNIFTASADKTIYKLGVKLENEFNFCLGLYTDDNGLPGTLLAQTEVTQGTVGWNEVAVKQPVTVMANQKYWLAAITSYWAIRVKTQSSNILKAVGCNFAHISQYGMPDPPTGDWETKNWDLKIYAVGCE